MADTQDTIDEQQRQREAQERANEQLRELYRLLLRRDPTASEYGLDREGDRAHVGIKIAKQHRKELATGKQGDTRYTPGLSDPKFREDLRRMLLGFGAEMDQGGAVSGRPGEGGNETTFAQGSMTPEQWRKVSTLERLQEVPVSFLDPSLTVRKDQVDTPEEMGRFLSQHGGDTSLNRQLLQAALNYGGLSIEPTPFGSQQRLNKQLEWDAPDGPGDIESRLMAAGRPLTPQELSAIAQERQGAFRIQDDGFGIGRMLGKAALTVPFALAGGYAGGALLGPLLGGAGLAGGGAGTSLGAIGAAPSAGAASSFIGGSPALFGVGSGIGAGAGSGFAGGAVGSGGDPNAAWQSALLGAVSGGLGAGIPSTGGAGFNALKGAGISGVGSSIGQGLQGDGFDWQKLLQAMVTGGAGGATSGLGGNAPGLDILTKLGGMTGSALLGGAGADPLANANAQLDRNAVQREQDQMAAMQDAQNRWKEQYGAAAAEAQAAQMEAFRAAQQEFESKKAEYEAKLQAFLDERQSQIEEALRAMGLAEPGIAGLLQERQKQIEAARAEQEAQRASLVESRNFFPSQLLEQTGDQGQSSLLVPHSPPPVLFGQEGLPASYQDYAQQPPPQFSGEGFLPSGSLSGPPPPSVAPMGQPRTPRYFPTLLNGLTRCSPYLRYA
jgi:hypothetical protein